MGDDAAAADAGVVEQQVDLVGVVTIGDFVAQSLKKRMRSPSGRASILKKGLALHDFPPLKESCLIWWITVRQGWRPAAGTSCGQSAAILKEKRYHTGWPNFTSSPAPVARSDLTCISARWLGTTPPGSASTSAAREPSVSQI